MVERIANNASSTLTAPITAVSTTLTVASATAFPSSGNFRIKVDNEIMIVTSVSGSTFNISRGQESTTAVAHLTNATVAHVLTVAGLNNVITAATNLGTVGLTASKPAATFDGKLYFTTNGPILYRDNATTYDTFTPMVKVKEPVLTDFSWTNQGTATAVTTFGGIYMADTGRASSHSLAMLEQNAPATPYTITCGFLPGFHPSNFSLMGMFVRESTSGKIWPIRIGNDGSNLTTIVEKMNSVSSPSVTAYSSTYNQYRGVGGAIWLKYYDDGTTRHFYMGPSLWSQIELFSEPRTTFLTADRIGIYVNSYSRDTNMHVIHWEVT